MIVLLKVLPTTQRFVILPLLLSFGIPAMAQTTLLHDFDDGTLGGWENILDLADGQSFGPTQFVVEEGRLIMSSMGPAPSTVDDPNAFLCVSWAESVVDSQFTNGFVRATIAPLTEGIHSGILLRENIELGADYEFWRDTENGAFYIGRFDSSADPQFELLASTATDLVPYEAGESWVMEAGAVGSRLSLKYWREGEDEPLEPQLTTFDESFPPFGEGAIVSLASQHFLEDPILLSTAFDNVQFSVPEPGVNRTLFPSLACVLLCLRRRNASRLNA